LGQVFTANMTGNVVLLAFGAAGTQGLPVLAPTVSLAVFLAGAEVPAPVRRHWVMIGVAGRHRPFREDVALNPLFA
jgi:uncharacterized membrane protein YoaK (UPF0700 family)